MRLRIIVPIIVLLALLLVGLGFAVAQNVSSATHRLFDQQLDVSLDSVLSTLERSRVAHPSVQVYQEAVAAAGVGDDGGIFVVDANGRVIVDPTRVMINQNLAEEVWYQQARNAIPPSFEATFGQSSVYAHARQNDDKLIVSYIPAAELNNYLTTPLYLVGVTGLVVWVIMSLVIYFLLTRQLIDPLESFALQLKTLQKGQQLETQPLQHNRVVLAAALFINQLHAGVQPQAVASTNLHPRVRPAQDSFQAQFQATASPAPVPGMNRLAQAPAAGLSAPAAARSAPTPSAGLSAPAATRSAPASSAGLAAPASSAGLPPSSLHAQPATAAAGFLQVRNQVFVDLMRATIAPLLPAITAKQLRFSLFVDSKMPHRLIADQTVFQQSLRQFLATTVDAAVAQDQIQSFADHLTSEALAALFPSSAALAPDQEVIRFRVLHTGQSKDLFIVVNKADAAFAP
ncbi:MAG: hypothetical protein LBU07_03200 [Coriobacteriales bacterium]|jgi:hypothetical protein|nr:hypothetical protein [Coriobacteriales bacterium]